ncbi:hypothetical protein LCGC14_1209820, partial [marine sediment metagenome]
ESATGHGCFCGKYRNGKLHRVEAEGRYAGAGREGLG